MIKKCLVFLLCLCLAFGAAGCAGDGAPETTSAPTQPVTVPTQPAEPSTEPTEPVQPMRAIALPACEEATLSDDGAQTIFLYSYQNVYLTLPDPAVAQAVTLELMNRIDATRSVADGILADAKANRTTPDTPYSCSITYFAKRLDAGVLSLSGTQSTFSGGVHPNSLNVSVTYDLASGRVLAFPDILAQEYSAPQLIALVLEALAPNSQYLYDNYADTVRAQFEGNLAAVENWYLSESGLCVYFSPYDLAPYAVGTVTAEIPYAKLGGILSDAYFPPERIDSGGSARVRPFSEALVGQYAQTAEVKLGSSGESFLIDAAEGTLYDVRIELAYGSSPDYYTAKTFFAMERMGASDAVAVFGISLKPGETLLLRCTAGGVGTTMVLAQYAAS